MKSIWIAIIALFVSGVSQISAQSPRMGQGPGIQQIIIQYGEQLNLTDEQKTELIAISLDRHSNMQRSGMRADWRQGAAMRGQRDINNQRPERGQRSEARMRNEGERPERSRRDMRSDDSNRGERNERSSRRGQAMNQPANTLISVYEVLNDGQTETLKSLLTDRVQKEHEFRTLRQNEILSRTEIEGEKADQVKAILDSQNETLTGLKINRIQNPDETDREAMRDALNSVREGRDELKELLTAAEYKTLQQLMAPQRHHQRNNQRSSARSR